MLHKNTVYIFFLPKKNMLKNRITVKCITVCKSMPKMTMALKIVKNESETI